jgi:hypothetical protein
MSYKWTSGSVRRGDIYAQEDTTGDATYIDWGQDTITFKPGDDATMFLEEGKVGINTIAPSKVLTVAGDISASGDLYLANTQAIRIQANGGYAGIVMDLDSNNHLNIGTWTGSDIRFYTNSGDPKEEADIRMLIDGATARVGNVGIGTGTDANARLDVSGSDSSTLLSVNSDSNADIISVSGSGKIGFGTTAPTVIWKDFEFAGPVHINSNMLFMDNDKGMKWGDGSVSVIGNATDETLTIKADSNTYFFLDGNAAADGFGTIGVGTSTPTATLHVSGSDKVSLFAKRQTPTLTFLL